MKDWVLDQNQTFSSEDGVIIPGLAKMLVASMLNLSVSDIENFR
jgi:hypothetical protein